MPNKPLMRGLAVAFVTGVGIVLMAPAAQASPEHPQLFVGGEKKKGGSKVALFGWGAIKISSRATGESECGNLVFGSLQNETEPGASTERAYGEVLEWTATGHISTAGKELQAECVSSSGLITWAAVEPELEELLEDAKIGGVERIVIHKVRRFSPSVPWREEIQGAETEGKEKFWIKTGIATTERSAVEREEATAGIPTESRTGCYHDPAVTELTRKPGFVTEKETELAVRPSPPGCIRLDFVSPEIAFETPFQGTLEPELTNGSKNALTPSTLTFLGGSINQSSEAEHESTEERSSERNRRELVSAFGPYYYKSLIAQKLFGFLHEELLTIK
jgi:hypothetical protein